MKKIFAVLCAIVLLTALAAPVVAEESDLSTPSWDEQLALREQLSSRDEWQPVEVPEGVWVVGEDIPAGLWTVTCETGPYGHIAWGASLDESGTDISFFSWPRNDETIYNPEIFLYEEENLTTCIFEAIEGQYVVISENPLTFTIPEFTVPETTVPATTEAATEATQHNGAVSDYVVNISSGKIHIANMNCAASIKESNRREYHCTVEELEAMGYVRCKRCW